MSSKRDFISRQVCKTIGDNNDTVVVCKGFREYKNRFTVSVAGNEIIILRPDEFAQICRTATNFEVYPMTDGTINMNLTFHDLEKQED